MSIVPNVCTNCGSSTHPAPARCPFPSGYMGTRRDEILDETIKNIASAPDEITYSRDRPVDKTIQYRDEKSKRETSNQATAKSDSNRAGTKNNKDDPFGGCLSSDYGDGFGDKGEKGEGKGKKKSKK